MNMHSPIEMSDAMDSGRIPEFVRRYRRYRRLLIALAVVLVVAIGAWAIWGGGGDKPAATEGQVPNITVFVPGRTVVADAVRVTGTIAARREMPVGVQGEGGMVQQVLVEAGQYVGAGQVLARLDRSVQTQQAVQMAAALSQARADARFAQAELDRAQTLVGKGFISKADIDRKTATRDSAAARVAVAGAQRNEMNARIARLDIRAPAAGLVLSRTVETGQIVGAGSPALFRIAKDGALEMRARVAEQDLQRLKAGQPAKVTLVGATTPVTGSIWLLEPIIDPQTRQGLARIALPRNESVRSGAFGNAVIESGQAIRPVLPQSAVLVDDKGSFVYVVGSGNKVERRDIGVGMVSDTGIGVIAGLQGNERVVLSAGAFLNPGEKVTPVLQARK